MDKLQGTFRLRVKIGSDEFEAEGEPDFVERRFEEFRRLASGHHQPAVLTSQPSSGADSERERTLDRLIRYDPQTQTLSLRILPPGPSRDADAALLVLLGHHRLRGEEEVPVTRLTEACRRSGLSIDRVDRVLTRYAKRHMILKAGQGKGGRYRLTPMGIKRAEELVDELSRLIE